RLSRSLREAVEDALVPDRIGCVGPRWWYLQRLPKVGRLPGLAEDTAGQGDGGVAEVRTDELHGDAGEAGLACRSCGAAGMRTRWQTFADNTRHIRAECARCGAFPRFLKQPAKVPVEEVLSVLTPADDGAKSHRTEPGLQARSASEGWTQLLPSLALRACKS